MKFVRLIMLLAAAALLVPSAALAKDKDQGKMQLEDTVQVGSTQLAPGTYKVEWQQAGPKVQVQILQHDKTVATTTGKVIQLQRPSPYDDVVLKTSKNGNIQRIDEIDFSNRREALRIAPAS